MNFLLINVILMSLCQPSMKIVINCFKEIVTRTHGKMFNYWYVYLFIFIFFRKDWYARNLRPANIVA